MFEDMGCLKARRLGGSGEKVKDLEPRRALLASWKLSLGCDSKIPTR